MFDPPSMTRRIVIGKVIGLVFGLIGFFAMPFIAPDVGMHPRIGILLWYPTVGAVIGAFGLFTRHPVLNLPLPWWFRSTLVGAWLNFVLTFFAYDLMQEFLVAMVGPQGIVSSPFWFVAEGALVGLVIGYLATRFGGEGSGTAGR
ncbi:MAG: hypothetical protein RIM72_04830 [Alphaproteobacteria bacterium]